MESNYKPKERQSVAQILLQTLSHKLQHILRIENIRIWKMLFKKNCSSLSYLSNSLWLTSIRYCKRTLWLKY